ncbi:MAG TPA: hypothetical protein VJA21_34525 [Verrucomicrobiae bacterium]
MKCSTLYPIVAGLVLGGMLLPGTVLAEKKTPFTSTYTETDTPRPGDWFVTDGWMYLFDRKINIIEYASDSRVAGTGWYSLYTAIDSQTGASAVWGAWHIENDNGAWDGYWTGTMAEMTATLVGSGDYEGKVSRWKWAAGDSGWSGYIVENGPGDVPVKISGWRDEQFVPIMIDANGNLVYAKSSLDAGGGQASHIGLFTDVKKTGLVNLRDGLFSATGTLEAPNGDLLNWVTFGEVGAEIQPSGLKIFFAGGTGRFEHLVGSVAGQMEYQSLPVSYTYQATGTVRY